MPLPTHLTRAGSPHQISQCCDSPRTRDQYDDDRGVSPCTAEAALELEQLQRRLSTQIKSSRRMLQIFTLMAKRNALNGNAYIPDLQHMVPPAPAPHPAPPPPPRPPLPPGLN